MCEVIFKKKKRKLLLAPVWPTAPHWPSACQTNYFGWQLAVKTAWRRTWEWREELFCYLAFCSIVWELSQGFTVSPGHSEVTHLHLCATYSWSHFTATYQLLKCFVVAFVGSFSLCFQSITSPQVAISFVNPPPKLGVISLQQAWKKSPDFLLTTPGTHTPESQEVKETSAAASNLRESVVYGAILAQVFSGLCNKLFKKFPQNNANLVHPESGKLYLFLLVKKSQGSDSGMPLWENTVE